MKIREVSKIEVERTIYKRFEEEENDGQTK